VLRDILISVLCCVVFRWGCTMRDVRRYLCAALYVCVALCCAALRGGMNVLRCMYVLHCVALRCAAV